MKAKVEARIAENKEKRDEAKKQAKGSKNNKKK
jgi:hypothetical protein